MKYLISLLVGLLCGVALFTFGLFNNPFAAERGVSPLSVSDSAVTSLSFTRVPGNSIAYTNNGETRIEPHPKSIAELWNGPVRLTDTMLTELHNARGQTVGIGVKFSSRSEKTRILQGKALVDSVWYVYIPDRGSLFIEQSENYWPFIQDVVFPAYRNSANSWKGTWFGDLTDGPGALGIARVTGLSGTFQGSTMEAIESMDVRAYSTNKGPVSAEGRLLIAMPPDAPASAVVEADE
jgi:hypothetical protein